MVVHQLKERTPQGAVTKCGALARVEETSGFQSAVTCIECRAKMFRVVPPQYDLARFNTDRTPVADAMAKLDLSVDGLVEILRAGYGG